MQLLATWLIAFQAIRLDGGRCFKGVHLSQVHQPRKALRNRNKKAAGHVVMSSGYTLLYKVLLGGALVSSAPTKQELLQYCSVGALETSAPPENTP